MKKIVRAKKEVSPLAAQESTTHMRDHHIMTNITRNDTARPWDCHGRNEGHARNSGTSTHSLAPSTTSHPVPSSSCPPRSFRQPSAHPLLCMGVAAGGSVWSEANRISVGLCLLLG